MSYFVFFFVISIESFDKKRFIRTIIFKNERFPYKNERLVKTK